MAKEQLHSWGRYILLAIVIIFTCGGYAMRVSDNTKGVAKNTFKIEEVREKVHIFELWGKDMENIATSSDKSLKSIDSKMSTIQTDQQSIKTDLAVMKVKVDTLTKDE